MIQVTKHAINQFKDRILLNPSAKNDLITAQIKSLFNQSRYISDNAKGILFRNELLNIEFVVKRGRIVTLFPISKIEGGKYGNAGKNGR